MSANSSDVMIPRIIIRDADDALLLIMALREYVHASLDQSARAARLPGADQFALSVASINETKFAIGLMEAMADGIMKPDPSNSETVED